MTPPASTLGAQRDGADGPPMYDLHVRAAELEMPWEVKHGFRTKALILAMLQTWVVLGFTVACDHAFAVGRTQAFLVMLASLFSAGISLGVFWVVRHQFPFNYLLLLVTTVLAGTFWAFTENSIFRDSVNMPMQVCIILATMMTMWLLFAQVQSKMYEVEFLFFGLFGGWVLGSGINLLIAKLTDLPLVSTIPPTAAVLVSTAVILAVVSKPMLRCTGDDYMIVAVAMSANLFLLVSLPVIMLLISLGGSGCSCDGGDEANGDSQRQEPQPQPQQQRQQQMPSPPPPVVQGPGPLAGEEAAAAATAATRTGGPEEVAQAQTMSEI